MFFDSNTVEDVSFEPLAKGDYNFVVTNVDYGPNKAGNGALLTMELTVEGKNEKIFHRFNLEHPNQKAANIGKSQLKQFCALVNRPKLNQPHDLMGSKIKGNVVHKDFNGETYANIKKFSKYEASSGMTSSPSETESGAIPF